METMLRNIFSHNYRNKLLFESFVRDNEARSLQRICHFEKFWKIPDNNIRMAPRLWG